MRLAREFESREGPDLVAFIDYLGSRAASRDREAEAATRAEGHAGVRLMTVHAAKGLEFEVVAVPDLGRNLNLGWVPLRVEAGAEGPDEDEAARVGVQLGRLGRPSERLHDYEELTERAADRGAEEEARLAYVAATRAKRRLLLSGTFSDNGVKTEGGSRAQAHRRAADPNAARPRSGLARARDRARRRRRAQRADCGPAVRAGARHGCRADAGSPRRRRGHPRRAGQSSARPARPSSRARRRPLLLGPVGLRALRLSLLRGAGARHLGFRAARGPAGLRSGRGEGGRARRRPPPLRARRRGARPARVERPPRLAAAGGRAG